MLKRRAFIIGSSYNFPDYSTIMNDVEGISQFLFSTTGGAWKEDEVYTFMDDSLQGILEKLENTKNDKIHYLFIYWLGPGVILDNQQILILNDEEYIALNRFFNISPRQCLILDTCRKIASVSDFYIYSSFYDRIYKTKNDRKLCRKIYDQYIKKCPASIQINYACRRGKQAYSVGH